MGNLRIEQLFCIALAMVVAVSQMARTQEPAAGDERGAEVRQLVDEYLVTDSPARRLVLRDRLHDFTDVELRAPIARALSTGSHVTRCAELVAWLHLPDAWQLLSDHCDKGANDAVVRAVLTCRDEPGVAAIRTLWSEAAPGSQPFTALQVALHSWRPDKASVSFMIDIARSDNDHATAAHELLTAWLGRDSSTAINDLIALWELLADQWEAGEATLVPEPDAPDDQQLKDSPDLAPYGSLNEKGMPRVVWVKPYTREDGVQVRGHWRARPAGAPDRATTPDLHSNDGGTRGASVEPTPTDARTWVRPHVRADGTCVRGHWRAQPRR
ncbi:MAG: hypothetical protein AB7K09_14595 [Planctomycetota bacterium]